MDKGPGPAETYFNKKRVWERNAMRLRLGLAVLAVAFAGVGRSRAPDLPGRSDLA